MKNLLLLFSLLIFISVSSHSQTLPPHPRLSAKHPPFPPHPPHLGIIHLGRVSDVALVWG